MPPLDTEKRRAEIICDHPDGFNPALRHSAASPASPTSPTIDKGYEGGLTHAATGATVCPLAVAAYFIPWLFLQARNPPTLIA